MFFWMFDVSPIIAALTARRPMVVWDGQHGNTYLALVDASDRMPVMRHYVTLIVQKGSNRYSRWCVLDKHDKYLSKGFDSQVAATAAAGSIARTLR